MEAQSFSCFKHPIWGCPQLAFPTIQRPSPELGAGAPPRAISGHPERASRLSAARKAGACEAGDGVKKMIKRYKKSGKRVKSYAQN